MSTILIVSPALHQLILPPCRLVFTARACAKGGTLFTGGDIILQ